VQGTGLAWNSDAAVTVPDVLSVSPWSAPPGATPPYPQPSNAVGAPALVAPTTTDDQAEAGAPDELREAICRMIIAELHDIVRGS